MKTIDILLIEDSQSDVWLTREALREAPANNQLHVVPNGNEALAFLRHSGNYHQAPRPDLILLDLNLPQKSGREVLAEIKADTELHAIPVIVLTTSDAPADIQAAYQLGANCFVTKPVELDDFLHAIRSIETFWLAVAKLPKPNG